MAIQNSTPVPFVDFVSDMCIEFNKAEALLAGARAIFDTERNDANVNHVYIDELIDALVLQLRKMRSEIDSSTYQYVVKPAE